MSNWWGNADGSSEHAFSGFTPIPDGTDAVAEVKEVSLLDASEHSAECFQVRWKILDGEYKKREVNQKIRVNDPDPVKQERAKNQLLFLMKMFHIKPGADAPTPYDLFPMVGKVAGIVVGLYLTPDGKSFNFVSEVHPSGDQTQAPMTSESPVNSAMSRNPRVNDSVVGDDIPF